MTRAELLAVAKPILFSTEMVQAVKDNRKTVTRRVVKPQPACNAEIVPSPSPWYGWENDTDMWHIKPPYRPGDILYVPEAWRCTERCTSDFYEIEFRDGEKTRVSFTNESRRQKWLKYIDKPCDNWQSPYFMPKEASRIFLRVTEVQVERLQDITEEQAITEGAIDNRHFIHSPENEYETLHSAREHFVTIWASNLKPADRSLYGWDASPWVLVIEFEKMEVES